MADDATDDTASADTEQNDDGSQEDPKTFDAEYVQKLRAEAAKYRTEAKANAKAAERLSQLEDANKSDAERNAERLAAAEAAAQQAQADALRFRIASRFKISDEHAEMYLHGSDEESLIRQAEGLAALSKPGTPRPGPSQGATGSSGSMDTNQIIRRRLRGG